MLADPLSRVEAINHLRANASDPVCVAMFHDMRIDLLDEDPLTSPLFFRFRCTRREWLTWGPLLTTRHPITHIDLSDFSFGTGISYPRKYAVWSSGNMAFYDRWERDGCLDDDDFPSVWTGSTQERAPHYLYFDSPEEVIDFTNSGALAWALREQGRIGEDGAPLPPLYQNSRDPTEGSFTPYADPPVPA